VKADIIILVLQPPVDAAVQKPVRWVNVPDPIPAKEGA
jgi:hypothetical protein